MTQQNRKKVYLDVCTLGRPFDDQSQMRVRLETDAYYLILQSLQQRRYHLIVSSVHFEEVGSIRDLEERQETLTMLQTLGTRAKGDLKLIRARAETLFTRKFGVADAAHVAFAEATADFFISCDDRLIKKCKREKIAIPAMNPVEFIVAEELK